MCKYVCVAEVHYVSEIIGGVWMLSVIRMRNPGMLRSDFLGGGFVFVRLGTKF